MPKEHQTRLWRAVRWYQCAERYVEDDADVCFIALWIALNACYANHAPGQRKKYKKGNWELFKFKLFANTLVSLDQEDALCNCFQRNAQLLRDLINNQYVFEPFWRSLAAGNKKWEPAFEGAKKRAERALDGGDATALLGLVLERLYVLRNQLLHGHATYEGNKNRDQVIDGKNILMEILPIIIRLMIDHPHGWGPIAYRPLGGYP